MRIWRKGGKIKEQAFELTNIELGLLVAIIFIAFSVRIWGITGGIHFFSDMDQVEAIATALNYGLGDLNPHFFGHPSMLTYVMFFLFGIYYIIGLLFGQFQTPIDFGLQFVIDPKWFFLIARFTVAFFGSLLVFPIFAIGRKLYNKHTGLLASFFMSLAIVHVFHSQLIKPDTIMVFFLLISFYYCILILEKGKLRYYIIAGFFSGLTIGAKYPGGIIIVSMLVAHFLLVITNNNKRESTILDKKLILGLLVIPIAFVITTPFSILDFSTFSESLWGIYKQQKIGIIGAERTMGTWFLVPRLLIRGVGVYLVIIAFAGFFYSLILHKKRDILLISFPLIYYFIIGNTSFTRYHDWIPILPFLSILAARCIVDCIRILFKSIKYKGILIAIIAIIIMINPAITIINHNNKTLLKDTRIEAKEWIEMNIHEGTKIAIEAYGPPIRWNKKSIKDYYDKSGVDEYSDETYHRRSKTDAYNSSVFAYRGRSKKEAYYMLLAADVYSKNEKTYYVYREFSLGGKTFDYYKKMGFLYFVINEGIYRRYERSKDKYTITMNVYEKIRNKCTMIKRIVPSSVLTGPELSIYKYNIGL